MLNTMVEEKNIRFNFYSTNNMFWLLVIVFLIQIMVFAYLLCESKVHDTSIRELNEFKEIYQRSMLNG
jgi:hypothetical protein